MELCEQRIKTIGDRRKSFTTDRFGIEANRYAIKPARLCGNVRSNMKLPMKTENIGADWTLVLRKIQSSKELECSSLDYESDVLP